MPARLTARATIPAATLALALGVGLLAGCSSGKSSSGAPAPVSAAGPTSGSSAAVSSTASDDTATAPPSDSTAPDSSSADSSDASPGGGAKCSDLTNAAATAMVGKATTVALDTTPTALPGLTICSVTVAGEVYPIQLAVSTSNAATLYRVDKGAFTGTDLAGVGDQAFSSAVGVETLSGSVDIKVTGPAGPVLNKDYSLSIKIAKAMIDAL
jgi:hypothetical protein